MTIFILFCIYLLIGFVIGLAWAYCEKYDIISTNEFYNGFKFDLTNFAAVVILWGVLVIVSIGILMGNVLSMIFDRKSK